MKKFFIGQAIRFGWDTMKSNFWLFVEIFAFVWFVSFIPSFIDWMGGAGTLFFIISIGIWILQIILSLGLIKITLKLHDNEKAQFSDLFSCVSLFWKYLLGSILYGLIVFAGIILLIVPGIILAIKYQFFGYLIVDKGLGPVEAIKRSGVITQGAKWNLFIFGILLSLINFLGALFLLIGLFATIPLSIVATAFVYRKLVGQKEEKVTTETAFQPEAKNFPSQFSGPSL